MGGTGCVNCDWCALLLGDFNTKICRENIFKPTIWNESLHEINNNNGVRVVNFATSKVLIVESTMFPHRNIRKFSWTSSDGKTHNQNGHIFIGDGIQMHLIFDCSGQLILILTTIWRWEK
jgi:hypothetical protein